MGFFKKLKEGFDSAREQVKQNIEEMQEQVMQNVEQAQQRIKEQQTLAKQRMDELMAVNKRNETDNQQDDNDDDDEPRIQLGKLENGILEIREGIKKIDDESLEGYRHLRKIIFPASLEEIEENAIDEQEELEDLDFSRVTKLKDIPNSMVYCETRIRKFIIPKGVTKVGEYFLYEAKAGTEVYVPSSVKEMEAINGNGNNDLIVYLFAHGINIEDMEQDIKTLYVLPEDYGDYAQKLKDCDSEARLREMPEDAMSIYQIAKPEFKPEPQPQIQPEPELQPESKKEETPVPNGNAIFSARLEALISAALKDGVLTEQEKSILKKRVEAEGEDWDEVEMIINARLMETHPIPQVEDNKVKTIVEQNDNVGMSIWDEINARLTETHPIPQVEDNKVKTVVGQNDNVGMPFSGKTSSIVVNQESNDVIDSEGYYIKNGEKIIIPTSTEVIEEGEFSLNEDIEKVVFPSSLVKIENSAFCGCNNLVDLDFSQCLKLKEIGETAFLNCGLKSVDLSRCTSLETIGKAAFCGCESLTNIVFPNSLCDLGGLALGGNEKLPQIDLASTNIKVLNDLFGTTGHYPSYWGKARDMKKLKHISFPASIQEVPEEMCFKLEMLESVDLSKCTQLKRICESAFACTPNLKEVLLPDNIEVMEKWAFGQCGNIKHIDMPPSIKEMGYGVFVGSEIESIDFSRVNCLKTIPEATFAKCEKLRNVILPASLEEFGGKEAFSESNIETVDFSKVTNLRTIPERTFDNCHQLKSINLPDCIKVIEKGVFVNCERLKTITMPASLEEVGELFFICPNSALTTLDFSKVSSLEVIPESFLGSDSIKTLTIPNGVTTIDDNAFVGTDKLKKMFLPPTLEHFGTFGYYNMDLFCFSPNLDELAPLVEDLEEGDLLRLHVLPQYLKTYIEQRDAEGISKIILGIQPMPDEYLYFYDN